VFTLPNLAFSDRNHRGHRAATQPSPASHDAFGRSTFVHRLPVATAGMLLFLLPAAVRVACVCVWVRVRGVWLWQWLWLWLRLWLVLLSRSLLTCSTHCAPLRMFPQFARWLDDALNGTGAPGWAGALFVTTFTTLALSVAQLWAWFRSYTFHLFLAFVTLGYHVYSCFLLWSEAHLHAVSGHRVCGDTCLRTVHVSRCSRVLVSLSVLRAVRLSWCSCRSGASSSSPSCFGTWLRSGSTGVRRTAASI